MTHTPQVKIGAYEAGSWNGIAFVADDGAAFQVRVGVQAEFGDYLDGDITTSYRVAGRKPDKAFRTLFRDAPFFHAVTEAGAHASDQSYCLLSWNPLYPYDTGATVTLEWSRLDGMTVVGRLTYRGTGAATDYNDDTRSAQFVLEANAPWYGPAKFAVRDGAIVGQTAYRPRLGEIEWDRWRFRHSTSGPAVPPQDEEGCRAGFHRPDFRDADWATVRAGSYWQEDPRVQDEGGYGWYRQQLVIPENWHGRDLELLLGDVCETDRTFLNGVLLEEGRATGQGRVYRIGRAATAYQQIRWGAANCLAVQVHAARPPGGLSRGAVAGTALKDYVWRPRLMALADAEQSLAFVVVGDQTPTSTGEFQSLAELQRQMQYDTILATTGGDQVAGLHYGAIHLENKFHAANNVLRFVAKLGPDVEQVTTSARALLDAAAIDAAIRERAEQYERRRVKVEGSYPLAAEMITNSVGWGALYSPEQSRVFTVDCRRWSLPQRWVLFANSAVLTAWACGLEDQALAEDTLRGVLGGQLADGRVMNCAGPWGESPDRSEDMYDAYVAWKLYLKWRNRDFLREIYPRVKAWNQWWFADRGDGQPWRDGNRDGLLSLGSNLSPFGAAQEPFESERYGQHHQWAMFESGYDDSPMWGYYERGYWWVQANAQFRGEQRVRYLFPSGTFNLDDVETNCLYALDTEILARMAAELGYADEAAGFRREYERIKRRINEYLWDDTGGMYLNRFWPEHGGGFSPIKTPVMFYALAAGVASPAQARRLIEEHLLNPREFWGQYVLPTLSRDDPCYVQQNYWRGSIWPPMNFFAYEGLKRYGYDAVAAELAEKTWQLVKENWDRDGGLYENYHSTDGQTHPTWALTTRHYNWSACLPLILVMECIDHDAWTGLRFGSIGLKDAVVNNVTIAGHRYRVQVGTPTVLERDGVELFRAAAPVMVSRFQAGAAGYEFVLKTRAEARAVPVTLAVPGTAGVTCTVDGRPVSEGGVREGKLHVTVPGGEHSVSVRLMTREASPS